MALYLSINGASLTGARLILPLEKLLDSFPSSDKVFVTF